MQYRLINLCLSALDEILRNVNINEAPQLLFDIINNAFNLSCQLRTKTYFLKIQLNHGFQGMFVHILRKCKTIIHS